MVKKQKLKKKSTKKAKIKESEGEASSGLSEPAAQSKGFFGYNEDGGIHWLSEHTLHPPPASGSKSQQERITGELYYFAVSSTADDILSEIKKRHHKEGRSLEGQWYLSKALARSEEVIFLSGLEVPVWILRPRSVQSKSAPIEKNSDSHGTKTSQKSGPGLSSHGGLLAVSPFGKARDLFGAWTKEAFLQQLTDVHISFVKASTEEIKGAAVGLEMGLYRFPRSARIKPLTLRAMCPNDKHRSLLEVGKQLGIGVNTARHLVNLPARDLNPKTYSDALVAYFEASQTVVCEVWDVKRLRHENMGLLLGVGQGAEVAPVMVVLRYNPRRHKGQKRVALVGKGVTFDTGGLDIKGADNMRLMKKDMGGSAALVGFAQWLHKAEPEFPCDIYLPLAENAVGANAIRPGDVLEARSGARVEIHNTDAEGRLVLADAIDVAVKSPGSEHTVAVIDVATLTGAIKVALGTKLAGLFCNYDPLAELLLRAGQASGDGLWRMPLVEEYGDQLRSTFADFSNSSSSRFAGAITAALFLQKFVIGKPWAHLDIYSWSDRPDGACREEGGSGQGVQCLVVMVERWAQHMSKL